MMTRGIKKRMYRNIALLIFLLLTSIAAAFAGEAKAIASYRAASQVISEKILKTIITTN